MNKKQKVNIDSKIKNIEENINKLNYSNGIDSGINIYKILKSDIDIATKELYKIEEKMNKQCETIYDKLITEDEFTIYMEEIQTLSVQMKETNELSDKIKIYERADYLIKLCKIYQDNIKLNINYL